MAQIQETEQEVEAGRRSMRTGREPKPIWRAECELAG